VNKTAANAAQLANCIDHKLTLHTVCLTSWHKGIFGLRTMRLKIFKKSRTASLNSEFIGFYKKKLH